MRLKFSLILLLVLALSGCSRSPTVTERQAFVFGTLVEVVVYDAPKAQAESAIDAVLARFDRYNRSLNPWKPGALYDVNAAFAAGRPAPVDAELAAILGDAKVYAQQSGETFDPAVGNFVRLWGFDHETPAAHLPDPKAVAAVLATHPSMAQVTVKDGVASSSNKEVRIDLGGYAKGYALGIAAAMLEKRGIRNALINNGGNLYALGSHGKRPWEVGIQNPRKAGVIATLALKSGEAIGTSGDYQRYFMLDGRRYCHLIDPRTGAPSQAMRSVTVLVDGPAAGVRSDVTSKPLFIGGIADLRENARRMGVHDYLALDRSGAAWVSAPMLKRLTWVEKPAMIHVLHDWQGGLK